METAANVAPHVGIFSVACWTCRNYLRGLVQSGRGKLTLLLTRTAR